VTRLIHGTRPTSQGPAHGNGRPPQKSTAGYHGNPLWPGITWGFTARCSCTWAPRAGEYQVKVRDRACSVHGGYQGAGRG